VHSNAFPLAEWRDGELTKVKRVAVPIPVDDYLRAQGRFKHLFSEERGTAERAQIQAGVDQAARALGLKAYGDLQAARTG